MKKRLALLTALFLLLLVGCGVQTDPVPNAETVSHVYTDWSKLTPYEPLQQIFTYHAGYRTDGILEARDDYGALLPYIGKYSTMEQYVIDALPFYGLVTAKGELVSNSIYARIDFYDDFLMLYRGNPEGTSGGDTNAGGTFSRTLAAPDGSWVRELPDSYYVGNGCGLLLTSASDGSLDFWNADGDIVMHFDSTLFTSKLGESFTWGNEGGPFVDWVDNKVGYVVSYNVNGEYVEQGVRLYLDFRNGIVMDTPPEGYPIEIDYSVLGDNAPEMPEVDGCSYLEPITDLVSGETYFYGYVRNRESEISVCTLFDCNGNPLVENIDLARFEASPFVRAGLCAVAENGYFCFRSVADNELVFSYVMQTNSD